MALQLFVETVLARHEWQAYDEAEGFAQELVASTDVMGEPHARAQVLLGEVRLVVLFRSADAMTPLTTGAERLEALLGAHAPATGHAYERLALAAAKSRRWAQAASALERAIDAFESPENRATTQGEVHGDGASLRALRARLATALEHAGRADEALRVLDDLPRDGRALGPSMLAVRGRALVAVGRLEEARRVARDLAGPPTMRDAFEIEARARAASGDRRAALAFHDAYRIASGDADLGLLAPLDGAEASTAARLSVEATQYALDAARLEVEPVGRTRLTIDLAFPSGDVALLPILERIFSGRNVYSGRHEESYGSGWDGRVWLVESFSRQPLVPVSGPPRPSSLSDPAYVAERGALGASTTDALYARFVLLAAWFDASEEERAAVHAALLASGRERAEERRRRYPSTVECEPTVEVLGAWRAPDRLQATYLLQFKLSYYAQSGSDWDEHHVVVASAAFDASELVGERVIFERTHHVGEHDGATYDLDASLAEAREAARAALAQGASSRG